MPSEKPKILFVADEDLIRRLDDYRFENRINSKSEAIRRLLEAGLTAAEKAPRKKPHKKE
jgi:metal-responsive CopG/Arc/MetJ family transcriptional regulator